MHSTWRTHAAVGLSFLCSLARGDALENAFRTPADDTRPKCYWYWLDGQVSKDGITKDLEAMKRVGIGEGLIGLIHGQSGLPEKPGPAVMTDAWWEPITHAVREGQRLGVDIGFFNSPAWSQSGGPWVKPADAMRYLVTRQIRVRGPGKLNEKLTPAGERFMPVAVLAMPAPAGDTPLVGTETRTPTSVTVQFPSPTLARSLTVEPAGPINVTAKLEASDDGQQWRSVREFTLDRHNTNPIVGPIPLAPVVIAFPAIQAKQFRVTFSGPCEAGKLTWSAGARVDDVMGKQLAKVFQDPQPPFDFYTWPKREEPNYRGTIVSPDEIQPITSKVAADGSVDWDVPAGEWVVTQIGMQPTGTTNSPASPQLTGLEVDKMNRPAVGRHFDAYLAELLKRLPDKPASLKHVVADSYEVGPQNWTDGFDVTFKQRYGYDPIPWLAVLSGHVVGSVDQSDRFLWDLRRLIADRISTDYVGALREQANQHGLKLWLENYGHWGFPAEFLQYGGASDEVGGEFWHNGSGVFEGLGSIELRDASSCAHTYGKNIVWAEAFTGGPRFVSTPRDLKARGDWAFCQGINQFVLHVYIHQPDDRRPGVSAWFGTEFNRGNTWFEESKSWIDYQRRCSTLLRQGVHAADVAYFIGEDTPKMSGSQQPPLPGGYDFDYINADVLLTRATVKDNKLTLPDGTTYHVLVLPPGDTMRPAVLKKIAEFVNAGLKVVGPLPVRSPSMEGYPQGDADIAALSAALKDRVTTTTDLAAAIGEAPDAGGLPKEVLFIHRRSADAEIYFLSNQSGKAVSFSPIFRVTGRDAELWHAISGDVERVATKDGNTGTQIDLTLPPSGSVFVVFRKSSRAFNPRFAATNAQPLPGPWQLEIAEKQVDFAQLTSWADNADPAIRYFSGSATYHTTFDVPSVGAPVSLDLGRVESIAEVTLNGKTLPAVWTPPYRVDLSSAIQPGKNELNIRVVNAWHNALAGLQQKPEALGKLKPWTSTMQGFDANTPLLPAGLIGPVTLEFGQQP